MKMGHTAGWKYAALISLYCPQLQSEKARHTCRILMPLEQPGGWATSVVRCFSGRWLSVQTPGSLQLPPLDGRGGGNWGLSRDEGWKGVKAVDCTGQVMAAAVMALAFPAGSPSESRASLGQTSLTQMWNLAVGGGEKNCACDVTPTIVCVCMYVCMYVCTYVSLCMYVCMYVCMYTHTHTYDHVILQEWNEVMTPLPITDWACFEEPRLPFVICHAQWLVWHFSDLLFGWKYIWNDFLSFFLSLFLSLSFQNVYTLTHGDWLQKLCHGHQHVSHASRFHIVVMGGLSLRGNSSEWRLISGSCSTMSDGCQLHQLW